MEITLIPRWIIRYLAKDYPRQNDINILISNSIIIFAFVLYNNTLIDILDSIPHFCLFDKIFNYECPVCGTTRAFCELSAGNITSAIRLNYSSMFVAAYIALQIPFRLITLTKEFTRKNINIISIFLGRFVVAVVIASWLYRLYFQF